VFETAGLDLDSHRERLFAVADEGHRIFQGGVGSGADVATAVHGGYVQFVRTPTGKPMITRLPVPKNLFLEVFWTGTPASTPDMVRGVQEYALRARSTYLSFMAALGNDADDFVKAMNAQSPRGIVEAADAYGKTLERLGTAAGVPIVTPQFAEVSTEARALGGTAKPSGAGGGDVGIALFLDPEAAAEFGRRCPAGISVLDVRVDLLGARRRRPGAEMI
jgi:phosphomevalonate kinase